MASKVRIPTGPDQFADATRVDFKPIAEPWCEFECADGTRLRVKLVVTEVLKIDGAQTPEGDPVYAILSSNVLQANVPDELKLRGAKSTDEKGKSGQYL